MVCHKTTAERSCAPPNWIRLRVRGTAILAVNTSCSMWTGSSRSSTDRVPKDSGAPTDAQPIFTSLPAFGGKATIFGMDNFSTPST